MIPPTSIDGTDITGATIDGTDVQEITVDGDVVFSATVTETVNVGSSDSITAGTDYRGLAFEPDLTVTKIDFTLMSTDKVYPEIRVGNIGGSVIQTLAGPFTGDDTGTFSGLNLSSGANFGIEVETEDSTGQYAANNDGYPFGSANINIFSASADLAAPVRVPLQLDRPLVN